MCEAQNTKSEILQQYTPNLIMHHLSYSIPHFPTHVYTHTHTIPQTLTAFFLSQSPLPPPPSPSLPVYDSFPSSFCHCTLIQVRVVSVISERLADPDDTLSASTVPNTQKVKKITF